MKLCMIGTGYVGLVSGTCFADIGNQVYCVDKDKNKIDKLNSGISPIYEPGLDELIKKNYNANRLIFTTDIKKAINSSDLIFICVGTPTKKGSLKVDLSFVYKCSKEILKYTKKKKIIITKSTVPVGTGDIIEKIIKKKKKLFSVISNPEFLREGEAIRDFRYPDRIVIGSDNKSEFKTMRKLYSPLISKGAKFFTTSRKGAELIKYASNAFLATKITFINELANLCEKAGVSIELIPSRLRGQTLPVDLKIKSKVVVEANKRITARHVRELEQAKMSSLKVEDDFLIGKVLAKDIFNQETENTKGDIKSNSSGFGFGLGFKNQSLIQKG